MEAQGFFTVLVALVLATFVGWLVKLVGENWFDNTPDKTPSKLAGAIVALLLFLAWVVY